MAQLAERDVLIVSGRVWRPRVSRRSAAIPVAEKPVGGREPGRLPTWTPGSLPAVPPASHAGPATPVKGAEMRLVASARPAQARQAQPAPESRGPAAAGLAGDVPVPTPVEVPVPAPPGEAPVAAPAGEVPVPAP